MRVADGPPTVLESMLRRERLVVAAGLGLVTALSWAWILGMSLDMYGSMRGASAWAMTTTWDLPHLLLLFAMWLVMMVAMMLPSAAPMLMLYLTMVRRRATTGAAAGSYLLAGGYLAVWALFSAAATAGQWLLTTRSVLSPMMVLTDLRLGAAVLLVVAAYQFTPLKRDCLDACRSPLTLIMRYWQPGPAGAWRMGLRHGFSCLGCCWALMLLLFVGGIMNAYVIGGLTLFVLIEKLAPFGRRASHLGGVVIGLLGVWLLLR